MINNSTSSNTEYLKLNELSEWLKVKPSTIHKYFKQKLMPLPVKLFGILLWDKSELENWIKNKKNI